MNIRNPTTQEYLHSSRPEVEYLCRGHGADPAEDGWLGPKCRTEFALSLRTFIIGAQGWLSLGRCAYARYLFHSMRNIYENGYKMTNFHLR